MQASNLYLSRSTIPFNGTVPLLPTTPSTLHSNLLLSMSVLLSNQSFVFTSFVGVSCFSGHLGREMQHFLCIGDNRRLPLRPVWGELLSYQSKRLPSESTSLTLLHNTPSPQTRQRSESVRTHQPSFRDVADQPLLRTFSINFSSGCSVNLMHHRFFFEAQWMGILGKFKCCMYYRWDRKKK